MNRQIAKLALTGCALLMVGAVIQGCSDRRYAYGNSARATQVATVPVTPAPAPAPVVVQTQPQVQVQPPVPAQPQVQALVTPQRRTVPAPRRLATAQTRPFDPTVATTETTTTTTVVTTRDTGAAPVQGSTSTNEIPKLIADAPPGRTNVGGRRIIGATNGTEEISPLGRPVIEVDVVPGDVAKKLEEYRMGPGDRLQIKVFGQDDISGEFEISAAGDLSYPLIGQISAENMTPGEFNLLLTEALKEFFVTPQVTVEITNYRPFFILGQVGNPGSYKYQPGLNARMAIAVGGGYTRRAREEPITIFRSNSAGELLKFEGGQDSIILPGDTVEVHRRLF